MSATIIEVIGIRGMPIIKPGDDLASLIVESAKKMGVGIKDNDIIIITHVVVARAEGKIIRLEEVEPSELAKRIAEEVGKDPRHVEVILRESKSILRIHNGIIISRTKHGIICANAGVDASNVSESESVVTLPDDPDLSAKRIREKIERLTGSRVAVIISDTQGRPFRRGLINVAIGCSGINPLWDRRGEVDLFGRVLRSKITCVADELCSAAELVIGQAAEGVPVAIIRGYNYIRDEVPASVILRDRHEELFI
ncbi:MAG: coenzyme F420-0:L-glutamate ligase [Nitrososphaerota archaeon]|nr:coenzyme F420-0:L-glutamate ligase [Aigarchaeota archaeon]MDW8076509.1 coenzyme F420-0:L-glutamate ligase [Nitrososphaerota archaeon]